MRRTTRNRNLGRVRSAVLEALSRAGVEPQRDPIERVRFVARGLSREAHAVVLDVPGGVPSALVVLVPLDGGIAGSARREARLLEFLAGRERGFRVPRFAEAVEVEGAELLVCEAIEGLPLARGRRWYVDRPWDRVADAAAHVHRVDVAPLGWLGGHASRREHGEHLVREVARADEAPDPLAAQALAWLRDHLPPDEPSCLLHGDLLGQNLLLDLDETLALIDWERATLGDPAYDLAVVTRGARQPFGIADGLQRLLDAYAERASVALRAEDVRFHEIYLHLHQYVQRTRQAPEIAGPLRRLLRWA